VFHLALRRVVDLPFRVRVRRRAARAAVLRQFLAFPRTSDCAAILELKPSSAGELRWMVATLMMVVTLPMAAKPKVPMAAKPKVWTRQMAAMLNSDDSLKSCETHWIANR
jgi:hypothetical protein